MIYIPKVEKTIIESNCFTEVHEDGFFGRRGFAVDDVERWYQDQLKDFKKKKYIKIQDDDLPDSLKIKVDKEGNLI
jgi:hypothetical protein